MNETAFITITLRGSCWWLLKLPGEVYLRLGYWLGLDYSTRQL